MSTAPVRSENSAARRSEVATVSPSSTTSAPYPRVARSFGTGTPSGMKIVAGMPSAWAARATPCAWFPAEAATTPRERSSALSRERR